MARRQHIKGSAAHKLDSVDELLILQKVGRKFTELQHFGKQLTEKASINRNEIEKLAKISTEFWSILQPNLLNQHLRSMVNDFVQIIGNFCTAYLSQCNPKESPEPVITCLKLFVPINNQIPGLRKNVIGHFEAIYNASYRYVEAGEHDHFAQVVQSVTQPMTQTSLCATGLNMTALFQNERADAKRSPLAAHQTWRLVSLLRLEERCPAQADALFNLGISYRDGVPAEEGREGIAVNFTKATDYLTQADQKGHNTATHVLALMHLGINASTGIEIGAANYPVAVKMFQRAGSLGNGKSFAELTLITLRELVPIPSIVKHKKPISKVDLAKKFADQAVAAEHSSATGLFFLAFYLFYTNPENKTDIRHALTQYLSAVEHQAPPIDKRTPLFIKMTHEIQFVYALQDRDLKAARQLCDYLTTGPIRAYGQTCLFALEEQNYDRVDELIDIIPANHFTNETSADQSNASIHDMLNLSFVDSCKRIDGNHSLPLPRLVAAITHLSLTWETVACNPAIISQHFTMIERIALRALTAYNQAGYQVWDGDDRLPINLLTALAKLPVALQSELLHPTFNTLLKTLYQHSLPKSGNLQQPIRLLTACALSGYTNHHSHALFNRISQYCRPKTMQALSIELQATMLYALAVHQHQSEKPLLPYASKILAALLPAIIPNLSTPELSISPGSHLYLSRALTYFATLPLEPSLIDIVKTAQTQLAQHAFKPQQATISKSQQTITQIIKALFPSAEVEEEWSAPGLPPLDIRVRLNAGCFAIQVDGPQHLKYYTRPDGERKSILSAKDTFNDVVYQAAGIKIIHCIWNETPDFEAKLPEWRAYIMKLLPTEVKQACQLTDSVPLRLFPQAVAEATPGQPSTQLVSLSLS